MRINLQVVIAFFWLFLIAFNSLSQDRLEGYDLFCKLTVPSELKRGNPDALFIEKSNNLLILSYDYNPSFLYFYDLQTFELIRKEKIPGHVYLSLSYFSKPENALFVEVGRIKSKYIKINLSDFNRTKVKCKNAPRGCDFFNPENFGVEFFENYTLSFGKNYILKHWIYKDICEVYLRM